MLGKQRRRRQSSSCWRRDDISAMHCGNIRVVEGSRYDTRPAPMDEPGPLHHPSRLRRSTFLQQEEDRGAPSVSSTMNVESSSAAGACPPPAGGGTIFPQCIAEISGWWRGAGTIPGPLRWTNLVPSTIRPACGGPPSSSRRKTISVPLAFAFNGVIRNLESAAF